MINITVDGVAFQVPSSAADVDWAAKQVAFEQALVASLGTRQRKLYADAVQVGNGADNTEDVLKQYNVPGSTLAAGKGLRITAWGAGLSTFDATTLRAYVGGQLAFAQIFPTGQGNSWRAVIDLLCIDAANATMDALRTIGGAVPAQQHAAISPFAFDVSAAQLIKFTGQRGGAAVANSVVQYAMSVELIP